MNIVEILKSFSMRQRLMVLTLVLVSSLASTFIKSYFTHSDCEPVQKQVADCIATQAVIVKQNHEILQKDSELTDDILRLRSLVANMKPDTVFIVKTKTEKSIQPAQREYFAASFVSEDTNLFIAHPISLASEIIKPIIIETNKTNVKKGNSKVIVNEMDKILEKAQD